MSLRAKARRLQVFAANQGCAVTSFGTGDSVLPCPRADAIDLLNAFTPELYHVDVANEVASLERQADYFVPSGRY